MNVFYTVAKYQNISLAAKKLGVTQPAISRIITSIEKEYNAVLFNRSKNGVTLTKEGQNLFEMIENPLNELIKVSDSLKGENSLKQNVLHIGTTTVALYCYFYKKLEGLKKQNPGVLFTIRTDTSSKIAEKVDKGELDFAFVTTPCQLSDNLEVRDIYRIDSSLIASNCFKDELSGPQSIKNLAKYPFVLFGSDAEIGKQINRFLDGNKVTVNAVYEVDNGALIPPIVRNGSYLAFIPDVMA